MNKIIAHRGIHNKMVKENTYLAIFNALNNNNMIGVEFDIRLTKDKKIVIIHDGFINRTSNGTGRVEKMMLKDLQKYNYGTKSFYQTIPLLEKVLEINTKKILLIEIKTNNNYKDFFKELTKIINKFSYHNIYFMSFDKKILNLLKKYNKNILIGKIYLTSKIKSYKYNFYLFFDKLININIINKLLNKEKEVFIWTINNEKEYKKIKTKINNNKFYYISDIK